MKGKQELEFLAMVVQDYIGKQDRSVQIALAEKAQACINELQEVLSVGSEPEQQ